MEALRRAWSVYGTRVSMYLENFIYGPLEEEPLSSYFVNLLQQYLKSRARLGNEENTLSSNFHTHRAEVLETLPEGTERRRRRRQQQEADDDDDDDGEEEEEEEEEEEKAAIGGGGRRRSRGEEGVRKMQRREGDTGGRGKGKSLSRRSVPLESAADGSTNVFCNCVLNKSSESFSSAFQSESCSFSTISLPSSCLTSSTGAATPSLWTSSCSNRVAKNIKMYTSLVLSVCNSSSSSSSSSPTTSLSSSTLSTCSLSASKSLPTSAVPSKQSVAEACSRTRGESGETIVSASRPSLPPPPPQSLPDKPTLLYPENEDTLWKANDDGLRRRLRNTSCDWVSLNTTHSSSKRIEYSPTEPDKVLSALSSSVSFSFALSSPSFYSSSSSPSSSSCRYALVSSSSSSSASSPPSASVCSTSSSLSGLSGDSQLPLPSSYFSLSSSFSTPSDISPSASFFKAEKLGECLPPQPSLGSFSSSSSSSPCSSSSSSSPCSSSSSSSSCSSSSSSSRSPRLFLGSASSPAVSPSSCPSCPSLVAQDEQEVLLRDAMEQLNGVIDLLREEGEDAVLLALAGEEDDALDPINTIVESNPSEALRFIKLVMVFSSAITMITCVPCLVYLLIFWNLCTTASKVLTCWIAVNSLLQITQTPMRLAFYCRLRKLRGCDRDAVILCIRRLTKSSAWHISKAISLISYVWFVLGILWLFTLPSLPSSSLHPTIFSSSPSTAPVDPFPPPHHNSLSASSSSSSSSSSTPSSSVFSSLSPSSLLSTTWLFHLVAHYYSDRLSVVLPSLQSLTVAIIAFSSFRLLITLVCFFYFFPPVLGLRLPDTDEAVFHRQRLNRTNSFLQSTLEHRKSLRKIVLAMCSLPRLVVAEIPDSWKRQKEALALQSEGCSICLTDFAACDCLRVLRCRHAFHQQCVDKWLIRSCSCPLCLRSILTT